MSNQIKLTVALIGVACLALAVVCKAQDYDDDNYQAGQAAGANPNENYQNADEGYNANSMPNNYPSNVGADGRNGPSSYSPQSGGDADGDYDGDDGSAAAASEVQAVRVRRSVDQSVAAEAPKLRVKRHSHHYIGPVYTYVKTDKHANFKWGVKHKVGKKHY